MANFDECVNTLLILDKCQENCRAAQEFAARYNIGKSHIIFLRLEQHLRHISSLNSK